MCKGEKLCNMLLCVRTKTEPNLNVGHSFVTG